MGREVKKLCDGGYRGAALAFGVDPCPADVDAVVYPSLDDVVTVDGVDCIIDFSHHSVTPALLDFAVESRLPLVLCTTGHTEDEIELIHRAADYRIHMTALNEKGDGFVFAPWCGDEECEDAVKAQAGVGSRCIYDEGTELEGKKCVCCGKDATHNVVWAKAY